MEINLNDIDRLCPARRRALLRKILERRTQETQTYPMSAAQESLWLLSQIYPESTAYQLPAAFRLKGPLQVDTFERALKEVILRHHVLRTTFIYHDGQPLQKVMPSPEFEFVVKECQSLPQPEQEMAVLELLRETTNRPFDLARGPLLRATLLRVGDQEHVVLIILHHIAADAWSIGLLVKELAVLYDAFLTGRPHPLPKLPLCYGNYAIWQRERLKGQHLEKLLSYWTRILAGAENTIGWPSDNPRPARLTFIGAEQQCLIPRATLQAFKRLCLEHRATLFMGLVAAFQALQSRYSLEDQIITGSPVANRNLKGTESLIGLFVNILPFYTDLSGNPDFRTILNRVRDAAIGVYQYQDLPFEQLVKALGVRRRLNRNPLFQAVMVLQNAPMEKLSLAGLLIERLPIKTTTVPFDLVLQIREISEGLSCRLEYNTKLFEPSTAGRLLGHFHSLLHSIVVTPHTRLFGLPLSPKLD